MSEKISYSEMAGALRKAVRHYEIFKKASEVADILNSFELELKTLEKRKLLLEQECEDLDTACNVAVEQANTATESYEQSLKDAEEVINKANKEAKDIVHKAKLEANKQEEQTTTRITSAEIIINNLKAEIKQLETCKLAANKEVEKTRNKIKEMKKSIIDSLN